LTGKPDIPPGTSWVKSSLSYANGNCVEVAPLPGVVAVRDSQDPHGPVLGFTPAGWRAFLTRARRT
jgi:hypothetical protein